MTIAEKPSLPVKETLFRGTRAPVETEEVRVQRHGGNGGGGVLYGVSLIATGEALGHDMWIDDVTLQQVAEFASRGKSGVKSRFTHPSMSADGLGRHLGRIHDVRLEDGRVIGDLHFVQSAHETPEGDLAEYVMQLAEDDPEAAGLSIVFEHDPASEAEFLLEHGATVIDGYLDDRGFKSPDPLNTKNYPHVRLAKLRAADIVDEPAANPEGLFDRHSLPRVVDDLLSYAAGLSDEKPNTTAFGVDADRATQFLGRWLESHGLSITPKAKEQPMSDQPVAAPEPVAPQPTREEFLAELQRYTDRFGAENGQKWFQDGKSFQEALELHCEKLSSRIEELESQLIEANEKLSSIQIGEEEPIATGSSQEGKTKRTFQDRINIVGSASRN